MFLYTEVLAMAGTYYESKRIPITFPIFIAITALSRLAILQKEQEPIDLLYEAGAILMLAIASYVLELRGSKFPQSPAPAAQNPAAGRRAGRHPESVIRKAHYPSPCPLQARLGELAAQGVRIRLRMRMGRGDAFSTAASEFPLPLGEG